MPEKNNRENAADIVIAMIENNLITGANDVALERVKKAYKEVYKAVCDA